MTITRTLAALSASLLVVASLTACFGGSDPAPGGGADASETEPAVDLTGTSWGGIDSGEDEWTFDFQAGGTAGFTYNGLANDATTGTWAVSGDVLTIHLEYPTYVVDIVGGPVGGSSIDLDGTYPGGSFELTITDSFESSDIDAAFDLTSTTWSGTDSEGVFWGFEFQPDGTVGLTLDGDSYDDPADVWVVSGSTLTITTVFTNGDYVLLGPIDESSIDLVGAYPDSTSTFTLTITRD